MFTLPGIAFFNFKSSRAAASAIEKLQMVDVLGLDVISYSFNQYIPLRSIFVHSLSFPKVLLLEKWMTKMLATHADNAARNATKNSSPEITAGDRNDKQHSLEQAAHRRAESNMNGKIGVTGKEEAGAAVGLAARVGGAAAEVVGERQPGMEGIDAGRIPQEEEKEAAMIRAQMSVLMLGFYEIVRQVHSSRR